MSAGDKLALAVIPEIDIWRAASLMLKRYGEKALEESAARAAKACTAIPLSFVRNSRLPTTDAVDRLRPSSRATCGSLMTGR